MTLLATSGPYVAVLIAAALAARALVVAAGRRFRPLARRLALLCVPLGFVFVVSAAAHLLIR